MGEGVDRCLLIVILLPIESGEGCSNCSEGTKVWEKTQVKDGDCNPEQREGYSNWSEGTQMCEKA